MDRLHEFMTSTRREVRRSIREASQQPLMADQDIRQGFQDDADQHRFEGLDFVHIRGR